MPTVKHVYNEGEPNGKEETRKMFEYAAKIGLWDAKPAPLAPGDRVEITHGGHDTDTGRITDVEHDGRGGVWVSLMLDQGYPVHGYKPSQLRRVAP